MRSPLGCTPAACYGGATASECLSAGQARRNRPPIGFAVGGKRTYPSAIGLDRLFFSGRRRAGDGAVVCRVGEYLGLMIRLIDILASFFGLLLGAPLLAVLWVVCWFDTRSPLFLQERMGRYHQSFVLVKFRTMSKDTASVASNLASSRSVTPLGHFFRKTKLDELPQLYNVLKGDMSLVGPRPNLFNQEKLINAREILGVYNVRPGITGLSQIKGINMSLPELLAKTDAEMISTMSLANYFKYIFLTVAGKGQGDTVGR